MHLKSLVTSILLTTALCFLAFAQQKPVGQFEHHEDVGNPAKPGSVVYDAAKQTYTITGSGTNMWAGRDEFHYVWKRMKGNFILRARVELLGKGVDPHRKIGWIVRQSLDADSPHANATVHGDGHASLQIRRKKGAETERVNFTAQKPDVIQLERKGNNFTMSVANFGETFIKPETFEVPLGDEVYVGIYVCSHNKDVYETAVFRDVEITVPVRDGFVPYREYIGSKLEVMELATNTRKVLYTVKDSLQAPNWTTDGKYLLYNHNGLLYRFDLKTNTPAVFDTGDVKRNNNDHVYSFDGKLLGISSSSAEDGNVSMIYTLPAKGGKPVKVTKKGPVISARLVTGQKVSGLRGPPQRRIRYLQNPRAGRGRDSTDNNQRCGRRAGIHARWQIHLLQFLPHRTDANLADEARRQRTNANYQRRIQ